MKFRKSIATGEVKIPSQFLKERGSKYDHDYCKANMFIDILNRFRIDINNAIVIGDAENDICMVKFTGKGISFNSTNVRIDDDLAYHTIRNQSLALILHFYK